MQRKPLHFGRPSWDNGGTARLFRPRPAPFRFVVAALGATAITTPALAGEAPPTVQPGAEPPAPPPAPPPYEAPPPLAPRSDHFHDGFYLRMSLGVSALSVTSTGAGTPDKAFASGFGMALDVLVGGTPMPGLVIGGGLLTMSAFSAKITYDGTDVPGFESFSHQVPAVQVGPMLDAFPNPSGGFHVGGQLGIAEVGYGDRTNNRSSGVGMTLWAGYDAWVAPQWSLGGLLRLSALGTERTVGREPNLKDVSDGTVAIAAVFTALYH